MGCDWPIETDAERIDRQHAQYVAECKFKDKWHSEKEWVKDFIRSTFKDKDAFVTDDVRDELEIYYEQQEFMSRAARRRRMEQMDFRICEAVSEMLNRSNELKHLRDHPKGFYTMTWDKKK